MRAWRVSVALCRIALLGAICGSTHAQQLLVDGGFETSTPTIGTFPQLTGAWWADLGQPTGAESGIQPYVGSRMIRHEATNGAFASSATVGSGLIQNVDVTAYAATIQSGSVDALGRVWCNRVAGPVNTTDTQFSLILRAFDSHPQFGQLLAEVQRDAYTDPFVETWQPLSATLTLPPSTAFIQFEYAAVENTVNDASAPEFAGHYSDAASLCLSSDGQQACEAATPLVPDPYPLFPLAGRLNRDTYIRDYVDLDPTLGVTKTWLSGLPTYDGHNGLDIDLRSFGEMAVGVPVFAALEGTVVDAVDGNPDICGGQLPCGSPANLVTIDHGSGLLCTYGHLKMGSVAVSPGQFVRAGQQIGLTGSSGDGSRPYLHFGSDQDGVAIEPFGGPGNPAPSRWAVQPPLPRYPFTWDFAITDEKLAAGMIYPFPAARTGTITRDKEEILFWYMPKNGSGSTWLAELFKPDGNLHSRIGPFGLPVGAHYFHGFPMVDSSEPNGVWRVDLYFDSLLVARAPFELVPAGTPIANAPPVPVHVSFYPPGPTPNEWIEARIDVDSAFDDPDYDIVSYRYEWLIDGVIVRDVTSASLTDRLAAGTTSAGQIVDCIVTPTDGILTGSSSMASVAIDCDSRIEVLVPGRANLYGATHAFPVAPGGGLPGYYPVEVPLGAGEPNQPIVFSAVSGSVSPGAAGSNGPDGGSLYGGVTAVSALDGISGISHGSRTMFLAGVFTGDGESSDPAPSSLDFSSGDAFFDLYPQLGQTFFIGDGRFGDGTSILQQFYPPPGATRLFLGFCDASVFVGAPGFYGDNGGALSVTIELGAFAPGVAPDLTPGGTLTGVPTATVLSSTPLQIGYSVVNEGCASSSGSWSDRLFLTQGHGLFGAIPLGNRASLFALAPGSSYPGVFQTAIPSNISGSDFYVALMVDGFDAVGETDELNNVVFSGPFTIDLQPQPDLTVEFSATFHGLVPEGGILDGLTSWQIQNIGTGPTTGGSWTEALYFSKTDDPAIGPDDVLLATYSRQGALLLPGMQESHPPAGQSFPVVIPPGTVPSGQTEVDGYYKVVVDWPGSGVIPELDALPLGEGNNVAVSPSFTLAKAPPRNLMASSVAPAAPAVTGFPLPIQFDVSPSGGTVMGGYSFSWVDELRLVPSGGGAEVLLGSYFQSNQPDAQGNWQGVPYSKTILAPLDAELTPGTYQLKLVVDANDSVEEIDETDNEVLSAPFAVVFEPVDLEIAIDSGVAPSSGAIQQSVPLSWTVSNVGIGKVPQSTWVDQVHLSLDGVTPLGPALVSRQRFGSLMPGQSYSVSAAGVLPEEVPGDYFLLFRHDVGDVVPDVDTSNDLAIAEFSLSSLAADLVVTNVVTDRDAYEGQPFMVSWTVQNQGSLDTASLSWNDRIWLSEDNTVDGSDVFLGSWQRSSALAMGESYSASRTVNLPYGPTGLQYLIVETDGTDAVFESNDDNNTSQRQVLMVGATAQADLTVSSVSAQANGTGGQPFQVSWTIRNVGPGPTDAFDWVDCVYLSTDTVLDRDADTFLGFYEHDSFLASGQAESLSLSFPLPQDLGGNLFVFVETNFDGLVTEIDVAPNQAYGAYVEPSSGLIQPVVITPPLPSDLMVDDVMPIGTWTVNQSVELSYRVSNLGANSVQGQWRDAVFLSADTVLDGSDVFVAEYTVAPPTVLAPGANFTVQPAPLALPGVAPGAYHVLVLVDSQQQIPEPAGLAFNLGASAQQSVALPVLTIGADLELELASGQSAWFAMTPPAGATVEWTADHDEENAWITLYGSEGVLPTPGVADVSALVPASDVQVLEIEGDVSTPKTWIGLVRSSTGAPAGSMVHLSARLVPLALVSVSPSEVGAGAVTMRLSGSKLKAVLSAGDVQVFDGNSTFDAESLLFDPSTGDLLASFDLTGAPFGSYSVLVRTPGGAEEQTLSSALQVEAPQPGLVSVQFVSPAGIKQGNTGFATARLENRGNLDLRNAVLSLSFDEALGGGAGATGLAWSLPELGGVQPAGNGTIESLVLAASFLAPGQSTETLIELAVPAGFANLEAIFGLNGRPLEDSRFFAPGMPPTLSVLGRLGEALRQAVLSSPLSPADLLGLAGDAQAWRNLANATFAPLAAGSIQLAPMARELGSFLDALDSAVAAALPSQTGVPAPVLAGVRGDLICLTFDDTGLACFELEPPATCNAGSSSAPLLVSSLLQSPAKAVCVDTPFSIDPNEKGGKPGFGTQMQVAGSEPIPYRIDFENVASAQATASFVAIEDPLEAGLDPSTFELNRIRFGDVVVDVPPGNSFYFTVLDLTQELGVLVQISAALVFSDDTGESRFGANGVRASAATGGSGSKVVWNVLAIDPATGVPPVGGNMGVLPPNQPGSSDGKGSVEFSVNAVNGNGSGAVIKNRAKIKFDLEAPLTTNEVENTLDAAPPDSNLTGTLVSDPDGSYVDLQWSGADDIGGSGILGYTVEMSVDAGPWMPILIDAQTTSMKVPVSDISTHAFRVQARDNTGQLENPPFRPDLEVLVGEDCNGNGVPDDVDVLSGTSADCNFNRIPDECELDSNGDGIIDDCRPLTADQVGISVSSGGTQRLSLQAGLANANRPYFFLGSITGTSPGIGFAGLHVPLNSDEYMRLLIKKPGAGPLGPNPGLLDEAGQATASFGLPPGLSSQLVGLEISHAYLLVSPTIDFTSNAVSVLLVE